MQQLTSIPSGARRAHGLRCPGTARNQLHGASPSPPTTPRDKAVTAGLKPGMALCVLQSDAGKVLHTMLCDPKLVLPMYGSAGTSQPLQAPGPRLTTQLILPQQTVPWARSFAAGDCPGYWEQAWGEGESPPESLYANQSTTPEGRAISAFLLQASAMDAGITNNPSFCRQTSKYKLFQARIRQQALFFNILAENRTGL